MAKIRTVTYRLFPNKEQENKMNHFLNCTRIVYNRLIEICKIYIEHHIPLPSEYDLYNMASKIRRRNIWMHDVHSDCFLAVAKRFHIAFRSWMKRRNLGAGFPRFKSWKMFDAFTYTTKRDYSFVGKNNENGKKERIRLGKIGLVKYSNHLVINGNYKTATVFRRKIGNHFEWNVSITIENEDYLKNIFIIDPNIEKKDVGIDLGLENLAVLSDGNVIPNDHTYKRKEKELINQQKRLSACDSDTPDYKKQLSKLSHKYKKLRNYRKDMFHKVSRRISEKYNNIIMEKLPTEKMIEKSVKGMRKSYRDAGWSLFKNMLCYKAEEAGNKIIFVNPAYTSQLCSSCGTLVPKDVSIRVHNCPQCGLTISRDLNAAINILNRGLGLQTEAGKSLKSNEGGNPERRLEF